MMNLVCIVLGLGCVVLGCKYVKAMSLINKTNEVNTAEAITESTKSNNLNTVSRQTNKLNNEPIVELPEALKSLKEINRTIYKTDDIDKVYGQYGELITKARQEWDVIADLYMCKNMTQLRPIYKEASDVLNTSYDLYKLLINCYKRPVQEPKKTTNKASESINNMDNIFNDLLEAIQNGDIEF